MWEEIIKAFSVYLLCTLKVIFGPTVGYASGLHLITTIVTTIAGMMTSVIAFTYFGEWIRKKISKRSTNPQKNFTPNRRWIVQVWKKFGLLGIAVLTPLALTPIGGTILAVSFGAPKEKIIAYMFVSATIFAIGFSCLIYSFGNNVLPEWMRP